MNDVQLARHLSPVQVDALSALASGAVLIEHWGSFEPHYFKDGKTSLSGRSLNTDEVRALARMIPEISTLWAEPGQTAADAQTLRLPAAHRERFLDVVQLAMPKPRFMVEDELERERQYERPRMAA